MKRILLAAAILASLPASASAATLAIAVFDNGALVGSTTAVDGTASLNITSDPAFDVLDINAAGAPFIPHADLSSVSLSVTSAAITGLHTLVVDIFQGGVSLPPFLTKSTFSVNNLIGVPGAATLSTFVNGTGILDLGTALASHVFPLGTITDTAEADTLAPALFADAQQYKIAFFAPAQSANDTIQLTTGVPEPSTWALVVVGAILLGGWKWRSKISTPTIIGKTYLTQS